MLQSVNSGMLVAVSVTVIVNKETKRKGVIFRVEQTASFRNIFAKAWWSEDNAETPPDSTPTIKVWNCRDTFVNVHVHSIKDYDEVLETALLITPVNTIEFTFTFENNRPEVEVPAKRLCTTVLMQGLRKQYILYCLCFTSSLLLTICLEFIVMTLVYSVSTNTVPFTKGNKRHVP